MTEDTLNFVKNIIEMYSLLIHYLRSKHTDANILNTLRQENENIHKTPVLFNLFYSRPSSSLTL